MAIEERIGLLDRLRGQTVRVPDLQTSFLTGWPLETSIYHDKLRAVVDARLSQLATVDPVLVKRLRKADFVLFTSAWWPYAPLSELEILYDLATWLFRWDDEIDESTGALTNDMEGANKFRKDTLDFVEASLGLKKHALDRPVHDIIASFAPIGDALVATYNKDQLDYFMREMIVFVEASEAEQQTRLSGGFPSLPLYMKTRMGTSAVGVCAASIEFGHRMRVPTIIMADPDMKILNDETNVIISVTNDILSIKKELVLGNLDSLIPIRCLEQMTPQESIDAALVDLRAAVAGFEAAAERLRLKYAAHAGAGELDKFIEASQQSCTGNLHWSSLSGRYGLKDAPRDEQNNLIFTL